MCGLAFIYDPNGEQNIKNMVATLMHRGHVDHTHFYSDRGIHLGHVRLPIQGLSHDYDQPYEYKNWVITFVGEIFNFKELNPHAKSDIEVLADAWDRWGVRAFTLFDGFWSAVIYDKDTRRVYVIVDPLAKKPLYYDPGTRAVASELGALCAVEQIRAPDNELYFSSVAKWGYSPRDNTFSYGYGKVPPGAIMVFKPDGGQTVDYYRRLGAQPTDLDQALTTSVRRRLISDVPVSLLVSGGVDSSLIYHKVSEVTRDFTIFHVDNDEVEYLNYLNIPGDIKVVTLPARSNDVPPTETELATILWRNEGPVDLGSMIPQYWLGKEIFANGFNVAISGDGADELFGGYRRTLEYDSQWSDIFEELVYYHLPRLDKLMMASTVELRCPFLSLEVLEGALALPYEERINKRFLRNLAERYLPKEIAQRPKLPLKSGIFNRGPAEQWRYKLIKLFRKEVISEYYRRNRHAYH